MILDIDIGNTCLKWRLSDESVILLAGREGGFLQEMLADLMLKINDKKVERVRLAHVLGDDREKEAATFFYKKINVVIECARTNNRCGEVINKYRQPEQLGVDRWLAILAAFDHAKGGCCIVDCGSAITIDFVLKDGVYVGGYIAPGLKILANSLSENTKLLPLIGQDEGASLSYGQSTVEALQNGVLSMATSFLEKSIKNFNENNNEVTRLYLTGGNAEILMRYLALSNAQINLMPNLVLDGLSIALP